MRAYARRMESRGRAKRRCIAAAFVLALTCACLSAPPALATCTSTAYAVNTQADETTAADGLLSLREAVQEANADGHVCDVVALPAGRYPITAAQGGAIQVTRDELTIRPQLSAATARDVVIDGGAS